MDIAKHDELLKYMDSYNKNMHNMLYSLFPDEYNEHKHQKEKKQALLKLILQDIQYAHANFVDQNRQLTDTMQREHEHDCENFKVLIGSTK